MPDTGWGNPRPFSGTSKFHYFGEDSRSLCGKWLRLGGAPEVEEGVAFFNRFRNMTASGFFSSKVGVADLGYMGNRPVAKWEGTPANVIRWLER